MASLLQLVSSRLQSPHAVPPHDWIGLTHSACRHGYRPPCESVSVSVRLSVTDHPVSTQFMALVLSTVCMLSFLRCKYHSI